ncbi:MAG: TonB family protein [Pseudomonadota bacterium]
MMIALRHYAGPFLLALLLHAAAVFALVRGFQPDTASSRIVKPQIVRSELVVLEPKAKPKPRAAPPPKPVTKAPPVVQQPPEPQPEPQPVPKPQPTVDRAAEERRARQERLDSLAAAQFEEALAAEAAALAEAADAAAATADSSQAQSYRAGIHQAVVANWSRPPSARRDMEAVLLVELVPTGEVVAVTVVDSSGSAAFDRSAEAAVRKVRRFTVPEESRLFEKYFRKFRLQFKPEDLWR